MSTKGSLHAAAKAKPKADWSLTHKAKRNSMLDFAKAIAASGEEEQGATPEKSQGFAMRPESSFYQAMSDVEALADSKSALLNLAGSFDTFAGSLLVDDKGADAVAGVKAKYDVSPDGDLFLLAQIEIACPQETALDLLWDGRATTVCKIWKNLVASHAILHEYTPTCRIVHIKFAPPSLGAAAATSARDTSVIANKYSKTIVCHSIVSSHIPPVDGSENKKVQYVRGDTKVLGFVVEKTGSRPRHTSSPREGLPDRN
mmetsp:Transcript_24516/g.82708  ORF Transcript_24516/g.82708 Transcript_24516/m.82708 type:complete len:258 (-) Transcript_24516:404-1177(-)